MPKHSKIINSNDYNDLLSLGIPAQIIDQANLPEDSYKRLLNKLKVTTIGNPLFYLKIDAPWQLQVLALSAIDLSTVQLNNGPVQFSHFAVWSGNMDTLQFVESLHPELLTQKDRYGRTIAHYAALSGNPDALQWIADNQPQLLFSDIVHYAARSGNPDALQWVADNQLLILCSELGYASTDCTDPLQRFVDKYPLLTRTDSYNQTIAHHAALSGNPDSLQWVANKYPGLLIKKGNYGQSIAHFAAWSGNPDALQWVADKYPRLLTEIDRGMRRTIAHYAAWSGNPDALQWVADKYPELLTKKDKYHAYDATFLDYAARSRNPRCLNKAISLNGTPGSIPLLVEASKYGEDGVTTLARALDDNFTLTESSYRFNEEIGRKLSRNQHFIKAKQELSVFLQGFYQEDSPISGLVSDALLEIFKRCIPDEVPDDRAKNAFDRIKYTVSPQGRMRTAALEILNKFSKDKLTPGRKNPFHKIGLMETNEEKIKMVSDFKAILTAEHGSLDILRERIIRYYRENKKSINHQRNEIHVFFRPNHKSAMQEMFEDIFKVLGISEAEVSAPVPASAPKAPDTNEVEISSPAPLAPEASDTSETEISVTAPNPQVGWLKRLITPKPEVSKGLQAFSLFNKSDFEETDSAESSEEEYWSNQL